MKHKKSAIWKQLVGKKNHVFAWLHLSIVSRVSKFWWLLALGGNGNGMIVLQTWGLLWVVDYYEWPNAAASHIWRGVLLPYMNFTWIKGKWMFLIQPFRKPVKTAVRHVHETWEQQDELRARCDTALAVWASGHPESWLGYLLITTGPFSTSHPPRRVNPRSSHRWAGVGEYGAKPEKPFLNVIPKLRACQGYLHKFHGLFVKETWINTILKRPFGSREKLGQDPTINYIGTTGHSIKTIRVEDEEETRLSN